MSNIHSAATSAYPLLVAGTDRAATVGSEARALLTCLCAPSLIIKLFLQSKQIPLLESDTSPPLAAGIRLGLACRERVRNPRSASDDVMFDVRDTGQVWMPMKLERTVLGATTY